MPRPKKDMVPAIREYFASTSLEAAQLLLSIIQDDLRRRDGGKIKLPGSDALRARKAKKDQPSLLEEPIQ